MSYTKVDGQIPEPQTGLCIARMSEQRQRFVLFYFVRQWFQRPNLVFMLASIWASKVLTTYTGQFFFSVQLATYMYKETVSCFLAVYTPSPSNQSFIRYVHFYILFLLFHHLPFSITIELFSKTSFTLLDSRTENAVDLLICPREKRTLSSHKSLFQHLCHLSRRYNPLHTKQRIMPTLQTRKWQQHGVSKN